MFVETIGKRIPHAQIFGFFRIEESIKVVMQHVAGRQLVRLDQRIRRTFDGAAMPEAANQTPT